MTKKGKARKPPRAEDARHSLRLPGFIVDEPVGLGDVVTRTTSYLGIRPCGGCDRRRAALNRWMSFNSGRPG